MKLPKTPFPLNNDLSMQEIIDSFKEKIPASGVTAKRQKKKAEIKIQEGLWRGANLELDPSKKPMIVTSIRYFVPGFLAQVIIFITAAAIMAILFTAVISISVGRFVPIVLIGGLLGFLAHSAIEDIFILFIKRSWSSQLISVIESIRAPEVP